ncbi:MAG: TonB-dependent receptor plug domain-containing protein [Bacteroidales bacterium]
MKTKLFFLFLLAVLSVNNISGQKNNKKITIEGSVVDIKNQPVVNAIIMIDNQKTSSTTDAKGNYKVKVKQNAGKIGIFTFGNGIFEQPINGRTRIDFTLNTQVSPKEVNRNKPDKETEVNVGYGSVNQKNSVYQISKIDTAYKKFATYNSIYDLIRGELVGQGVRVDPGNNIIIEGSNTLMGPTSPLMVVDGMIVSSIDYIHPQMVKSIEVLKGASASVYGSRGSNGVILITLVGAGDLK